ncbi:outer membrane protein [Mesorhizobium sp. KR1-2]|uniref:outer membrane protein n=1 Tax=Mesorhizobium sp. KR1-2 TaxID=3156609 RepID=UPI0032B4D231
MSLQSRIILSLAAAVLWHPASAMAADYEPPIVVENAPEYVPVEVASSWYLRGDVGYNFNRPFKNNEIGPSPIFSFEENNSAFNGGVGMGYHFNDFLRGELNVSFLSKNSAELSYLTVDPADLSTVVSGVSESAKNWAWSGMVNGYADLGTFVGLTPYVGAGVGVFYSRRSYSYAEDFRDSAFVDVDYRDSKRQTTFAYSLGAGLAYQLTPNTSVDLGYQYLSAPNAERVEMYEPGSYTISKGVHYHQLKLGLRYDLW